MRIPESHALAHKIIGKISCSCVTTSCGFTHALLSHHDASNQIDINAQTISNRIDCVKEGLFILLIIFVVGQWLGLHKHE